MEAVIGINVLDPSASAASVAGIVVAAWASWTRLPGAGRVGAFARLCSSSSRWRARHERGEHTRHPSAESG
eukprot:6858094-Alexandrium_andersonii.AAC.1